MGARPEAVGVEGYGPGLVGVGRPVLVGEAPSRLTDGGRPFEGRSGRFLERLLGIPTGALPTVFALQNLARRWPGSAGKGSKAPTVVPVEFWPRIDARSPRVVVLAGKRVAKALGLATHYFRPFPVFSFAAGRNYTVVVVPHPSGVNRWWNDPASYRRASRYLRRLVGVRLLAEARRNG